MRALLGTAVVAAVLAWSGPSAIASANKVPQAKAHVAAKSDAADFSARRRHHRYGYAANSRPYWGRYPYYYARPVYYRPYPYPVPAPFIFGIGYGW